MSVEISAAVAKQYINETLLCDCPRRREGRESGEAADNHQRRYKSPQAQPQHPLTAIAEHALRLHVSSGLSCRVQWHILQN